MPPASKPAAQAAAEKAADKSGSPHFADDPKGGSIRALRVLNFFIADVQNDMGPYMALFL